MNHSPVYIPPPTNHVKAWPPAPTPRLSVFTLLNICQPAEQNVVPQTLFLLFFISLICISMITHGIDELFTGIWTICISSVNLFCICSD